MRLYIILFIITFPLLLSSQGPEAGFIEHFKTSVWVSLLDFNDSGLKYVKEIKLVKSRISIDSLKYHPHFRISQETFQISYFYREDSHAADSSTYIPGIFKRIDCQYSYNKGILTIVMTDKNKTTLRFKTAIVSTESFILLSRTK